MGVEDLGSNTFSALNTEVKRNQYIAQTTTATSVCMAGSRVCIEAYFLDLFLELKQQVLPGVVLQMIIESILLSV